MLAAICIILNVTCSKLCNFLAVWYVQVGADSDSSNFARHSAIMIMTKPASGKREVAYLGLTVLIQFKFELSSLSSNFYLIFT